MKFLFDVLIFNLVRRRKHFPNLSFFVCTVKDSGSKALGEKFPKNLHHTQGDQSDLFLPDSYSFTTVSQEKNMFRCEEIPQ